MNYSKEIEKIQATIMEETKDAETGNLHEILPELYNAYFKGYIELFTLAKKMQEENVKMYELLENFSELPFNAIAFKDSQTRAEYLLNEIKGEKDELNTNRG